MSMLSISQMGYSKYETGENDIPTRVLIELARIYGTSIDYLLGQTNNPKRNYGKTTVPAASPANRGQVGGGGNRRFFSIGCSYSR